MVRESSLPHEAFAAYGDLETGVFAMLALFTVRVRRLFWALVVAFNVVGAAHLILDYYRAVQVGLPALAAGLEHASIDAIRAGLTPVQPVRRVSLLHAFAVALLRHNESSRTTFERSLELFGN